MNHDNNKKIEFVSVELISVKDRARKLFSPEGLAELAKDISSNSIGLLHAPVIKENGELITGERRYKVCKMLHESGQKFNFAGEEVPYNTIPVVKVSSSLELLDYLISECVENTSRQNFTWQEKAALDYRIAQLQQAKLDKERQNSEETSSEELSNLLDSIVPTAEAIKPTAIEKYGKNTNTLKEGHIKTSIKLITALEDPEFAKKLNAAPTRKEAEKLLKVEEKRHQQAVLAQKQGKEFRAEGRHIVIHGDCITELKKLPESSVDLCLCDPIYGINAHKFGVAKRDTGFHTYEDTYEEFCRILPDAIKEVSRILKPASHLYLFCDLSRFYRLKEFVEAFGDSSNPWTVQSYPLYWIKKNGSRCPVPGYTYRKTVEHILYAYRGGKQSNHQLDSHFEVSTARSEIHGAAKDPSGLKILLANSASPGDTILDFMAGSGSLAVAAHEMKMKSILIEADESAYGRCIERVQDLMKG